MIASREPFVRGCEGSCDPPTFVVRLTASGQPDPTYGEGGVAKLASPSTHPGPNSVNALLVGSDGSALLAGNSFEEEAVASALSPAGAPDSSFGEGGTLVEHLLMTTQLEPTGLALKPNGGLAVMNQRSTATGYISGYLLNFGRGGKQLPAPDGSPAIKATPHGAILPVPGGYLVWEEEEARTEHVLHAFGNDGAPLAGFGTDGTVTLPHKFVPQAAESAPGGGCVLAGTTAHQSMVVYRIGADGKPLSKFGHDGLGSFSVGGEYGVAEDALVEADGDTVLTGWIGDRVGVVRLRPDGKPDRGFGRHGLTRVSVGKSSTGDRIVAWPGGGVVVAATEEGAKHQKSTHLIRLDDRGHPVRGFGHRGVADAGTENRPLALLVTGHRIVVVTDTGFEGGAHRSRLKLSAFLPDGAPDRAFARDGVEVYGRPGGERPSFFPVAAVAQAEGKVVVAGTAAYDHFHTNAELLRVLVP